MRVLFLSFYYTPDLCAGSFRASALMPALRSRLPSGSHIDVLTTMPNRYSSFSAAAPEVEESDGMTVHRIMLPSHNSGMRDQSRSFLAYAGAVRKLVHGQHYDLVVATSSRLMTAVLGAHIARGKKAPLYLDIRDIFVDTIQDVLPRWSAPAVSAVFSLFERYAIGTASRVNLVSRGFEDYFAQRFPRQQLSFFPNGIDDEFLQPLDGTEPAKVLSSILYAGNIGEGQGLHAILPELSRALKGKAEFIVIGDGGRKQKLKNALQETDAVELKAPVGRPALLEAYQHADVLFLHLNDYDAFRKVLPSKIFEYAATGKPILAGVAGYAADFIHNEVENAEVFAPCDVNGAVAAFSRLKLGQTDRSHFVRIYDRQTIMQSLASDIVAVGMQK